MNKRHSLATLMVLLASTACGRKVDYSTGKVVGGSVVTADQQKKFAPIFQISFGIGNCTASYLGKGQFLTARHCLLSATAGKWPENWFDQPSLTIDGNGISDAIENRAYSLSAPPVSTSLPGTDSVGEAVAVLNPDVLLVQVKYSRLELLHEDLLTALKTGPAATPTYDALAVHEPGTEIAGFGQTTYDLENPDRRFKTGMADITTVNTDYFEISWDKAGPAAGAAPGDSGGPLFKLDQAGGVHVYGVASYISRLQKDSAGRDVISAKVRYTNLANPEVKSWLTAATANK